MKRGIIWALAVIFICSQLQSIKAQEVIQDSLSNRSERVASLLIPTGLVACGAFIHGIEEHRELNYIIRDEVQGWQMEKTKADDYIQYLPSVAFAVMNLTDIERKGNRIDNFIALPLSYLFMGTCVLGIKHTVPLLRPDGSAHNTFPSGHTATAFVGAELVRETYWETSPLYGIAAYTVAASVGFFRIYNDRHWFADVVAGAGFGILSARLALWAAPYVREFFQERFPCLAEQTSKLHLTPFGTTKEFGLSFNLSF